MKHDSNVTNNETITLELYDDWAEVFDAYWYPKDEHPDGYDEAFVEGLNTLFKEYGIKKILDCACGTGNPSLGLAALGYNVYCSDLSNNMLTQLKKKADAQQVNFKGTRSIRWMELPDHFGEDQFDALVCTGNALFHITKEEEFVKTLQKMRSVLKKDGILYADYISIKNDYTYHVFERLAFFGVSPYNSKNLLKFRVLNQFDPNTKLMQFLYYYLLEDGNGNVELCPKPFIMQGRPFLIHEIYDFLKEAGFRDVKPARRDGLFQEFHAFVAKK